MDRMRRSTSSDTLYPFAVEHSKPIRHCGTADGEVELPLLGITGHHGEPKAFVEIGHLAVAGGRDVLADQGLRAEIAGLRGEAIDQHTLDASAENAATEQERVDHRARRAV